MAMTPLGDTLRRHAERRPPSEIAVAYPDGALTWGELDRRVTRRARLLESLGVGQDDLVTLALPNSTLAHETAFALWKLGATPNVVSHRLPDHEFRAIVELARPRLVVGGRPEAAAGWPWIAGDADASRFSPAPFPSRTATYWKAMTSGGSTGRPKIIVDHQRACLDTDVPAMALTVGMNPESVVLNPGPLYHNAPFIFTNQALAIGARVVGMARFDAEEALRLIERHRVTWMSVVPTMMHRIWSLPRAVRERYDVSSLDRVWHMAAPCPAWLKAAWIDWLGPTKIYELYGGTERTGSTVIRGDEWLTKPGSVGRVVGDKEIGAFREDGAPCAPGEVGELFFRGPEGAERPFHYLGAEEKRRPGGWASIGDLGHVDADGYVFLADRRTDLILRGGANIYPAEVEGVLDAHPGVASSVVVGLPCEELGQRIHAIIEPRPHVVFDLTDLHAFAAERLARNKLPETYEVAREPLRDDAGKVRRTALRDERVEWLRTGREFRSRIAAEPQQEAQP